MSEYQLLKIELDHIRQSVDEIKLLLKEQYVTKAEYNPVARIVFGMVALMGIGLCGAILKMVLK